MAYFGTHKGGVGLRPQPTKEARSVFPGLCLAVLIAAFAFGLRHLPGIGALSPLILAILIGMAYHNLIGTPAIVKAGVSFSLKHSRHADAKLSRPCYSAARRIVCHTHQQLAIARLSCV